jgi:HlyD family secretion protein
MNFQPATSTILSTAIVAIGGVMVIGWTTRRFSAGGLFRSLLRFLAMAAFVIVIGLLGLIMARSQPTPLPQNTPIIQPIESMTVKPGTLTETLGSTGAIAPADQKTLSFGVSAPVTEVLVKVGDTVKAGDVLARVDTANIDSQIRGAQISLTQAQNSLAALTAPPRDIDVKIAQESVTAAQASLSSASQTGSSDTDIQIAQLQEELSKNSLWQAQLNRDISAANTRPNQPNAAANDIQANASLAQSESNIAVSQANYNATVNDGPSAGQLASANAQLVSAQASLDSLLSGPTDAQLRQAQIAVETAQLAYDQAQKARDDAEIVAPFDGIVAAVNAVVGSMPPATGAITLIDTSSYTITLAVDEKDIPRLSIGQPVSLTLQALNNAQVQGAVTRIDPAPTLSGQLVNYNVQVTLDPGSAHLRPGMSGVASVTINQVNNVLVLPNRFITVNSTTQAATVKVQTGTGTYQDIPVTLGTRTDSESEITGGLNAGQTVVILPSASQGAGQGSFGLFGGLGRGGAAGGGNFPSGGAGGGNFNGGGAGR